MITILRWHVAREQLWRLVEGQGHSMTLQQNHVWPITWLFAVIFNNYFWQTTSVSDTYSGSITRFDRLLFWTKVVLFGCMVKYLYFFYLFITVFFSFDDSVIWTRPLFMFINDVVNDQKKNNCTESTVVIFKGHNTLSKLSVYIATNCKYYLGLFQEKVLRVERNLNMGLPQHSFIFFWYSPYGHSRKHPHPPNFNWFPFHPLGMPFSLEQPLVKMFL